jgi:hypothetical protein
MANFPVFSRVTGNRRAETSSLKTVSSASNQAIDIVAVFALCAAHFLRAFRALQAGHIAPGS